MNKRMITAAPGSVDRFFKYVNKTDRCWLWTGGKTNCGYGRFRLGKHKVLAHRFSWTLAYDDPSDLCVLHRCDNPPCVNPDHLFLGTQRDNCIDMFTKGREICYRGEDHYNSKLSNKDVVEIKRMLSKGYKHKIIADKFGVVRQTIQNINVGYSWRSLNE